MSGPLTLSLDIGTSSTRALLWDLEGREAPGARSQIAYQMRTTPDGGVEMDADELLQHVYACLDGLFTGQAAQGIEIRAAGMSTFWHSLLGIDAAGKPVTPVYSWADTRSAGAAERLRAHLDAEALHQRTGCVIHPSYYPAKLRWLRESWPDLFARTARWISPSELVMQSLFGPEAACVSVSIASGTGLMNQKSCDWDPEALAAAGISRDLLAEIADRPSPAGGMRPEMAARWPALRSTTFYPPAGDGACGNIGSGCSHPGRFAINVGTSGAIRALWDAGDREVDQTPAGLWRYRADAKRPIIGAAFSDGGAAYAWLKRVLRLDADAELEERLVHGEPGGSGLTCLPFLAGERSLGWHPGARGAIAGLSLNTGPLEIAAAIMEGVALQFAEAERRMEPLFGAPEQIIASGGALGHSAGWAQMFADVLGLPLTLAEEPEASSRGAAILAMEAADMLPGNRHPEVRLGRQYLPDMERHARFDALIPRRKALYEAVIADSPGGGENNAAAG